MIFGVRGHDFTAASLTELSAKCAELGIDSIQLALGKSLTDFKYGAFTPAYARKMKSILGKNNIRISVLGAYIRAVHNNPEERRKQLDFFVEQLRYAKFMDADMVGLETGYIGSGASIGENLTEGAYRYCLESMSILADAANKLGVMMGIEGVESHVINTPDKMARLIDDLDSPNIGVIFDPVNYINGSNYRNQDYIIKRHFELLYDKTYVIHLKDYTVNGGKIRHLNAGDGMMNYELLFSLVKKYKRDIPMILEGVDEEKYAETASKLNELYKNA